MVEAGCAPEAPGDAGELDGEPPLVFPATGGANSVGPRWPPGHGRLRDGLDDERAGTSGVCGHDLPQKRRPRVLRKLVGGIGGHDGRGARRESHAREVAAAHLGIEASARHVHRASSAATGGARRQNTRACGAHSSAHAARPHRFRSRDRQSDRRAARRRPARGRWRARRGSGEGVEERERGRLPRRRARRPARGGRGAPRKPTRAPAARAPLGRTQVREVARLEGAEPRVGGVAGRGNFRLDSQPQCTMPMEFPPCPNNLRQALRRVGDETGRTARTTRPRPRRRPAC